MTTPQIPVADTNVLVAAAWIATIPGFTTAMTGDRLPPDVNADGTPAAWIQTGFAVVAVVGGTPGALLPVSKPVMDVKCYAALPGSNDPPWDLAEALGAAIKLATWDRRTMSRPLTPVVNGVTYPVAVVQGAYMATEFRRSYDDPADYACVQGDLALTWITPSVQIP